MEFMCRTTKKLWVTGKMLVMGSGLCVLKVLIHMYERGLYGSAVAKKRIYQPAGIYGDKINGYFERGGNR